MRCWSVPSVRCNILFSAVSSSSSLAVALLSACRFVSFDPRSQRQPQQQKDSSDSSIKPQPFPRIPQVVRDRPYTWEKSFRKFNASALLTPAGKDEPRSEQQIREVAQWAPVVKVTGDLRLRVALVGRTNSGKSSLFNKLVGRSYGTSPQIAHNFHGITRDAVEAAGYFGDMCCTIIDTPGSVDGLITTEAQRHIETADVAVLIGSADAELNAEDQRLASLLLSKKIPSIVVVNKMDMLLQHGVQFAAQREVCLSSYESLGLGRPIPISVHRGEGLDILQQSIEPLHHIAIMQQVESDWDLEDIALGGDEAAMEQIRMRNVKDRFIRVAILGRTNSGKSALLNRLIGHERSRSHEDIQTTRDAIEVACHYKGKRLKLIDTAGMMRKRGLRNNAFREELDKLTRRVLKYAHIAIICFDARDGHPCNSDIIFCKQAAAEGRPFVLAANKWDAVYDPNSTAEAIDFSIKRIHETKYSHAVVCSAMTGLNLTLLLDEVIVLHDRWNKQISGQELTRFWRRLEKTVVIPSYVSRISRISQSSARPPTFVLQLQTRDEWALLGRRYTEMIKSALTEEFDFRGVPLRILQQVKTSHPDYI